MSQLSTTNTVTEYKIILKDYFGNPIRNYLAYEDYERYAIEKAKELVMAYANKYNQYCEAEITKIIRPAWD